MDDILLQMDAYPPLTATKKDQRLEDYLKANGFARRSQQHYGKDIGGFELAVDKHIGHYCVGWYQHNRQVGPTKEQYKPTSFQEAVETVLLLEKQGTPS